MAHEKFGDHGYKGLNLIESYIIMNLFSNIRRNRGEYLFKNNVEKLIEEIKSFLSKKERILDLGAGTCMFTKVLREKGYNITPVDIKNKSYYLSIIPVVYNGTKLPFPDKSFDTCLIIAVLHHTQNPEKVLQDAIRVTSKKIIILEDLYTNKIQKYYTFAVDSFLNKEFIGHPHTNKDDESWHQLFQRFGLKLEKSTYSKAYGFLQNVIYYLKQ